MKNKHNYIAAAENIVAKYQNSVGILKTADEWRTYVRRNNRGWKAVRLAGYLTCMGLITGCTDTEKLTEVFDEMRNTCNAPVSMTFTYAPSIFSKGSIAVTCPDVGKIDRNKKRELK